MSKLVYDVVLLPPPAMNHAAIQLSQRLQELGTEFVLGESVNYPHVSLYMANFTAGDIQKVTEALQAIATRPALKLHATHFTANDQGMCEVFFEKIPAITSLQEGIISSLNPLRQGLREFDPVGRRLAGRLRLAEGEERLNITEYGYDEVGSFFNPHITLTRFKDHQTPAPIDLLSTSDVFSGTYTILGLFEMGAHGTCTKLVASWRLETY